MLHTRPTRPLTVSRRQFVIGTASLAGAAAWPVRVVAQTAPHSFKHGAFEITVVSDGHLELPPAMVAPGAPAEALEAALQDVGQAPDGDRVNFATNTPIVRSGPDLIVFDTGSGPDFQPTAGKLAENLSANGIDPGKVTKIVFTHAHPDHIWGTVAGDGLRYPNAGYYVAAAEWDFWMDPALATQVPAEIKPFVLGAQKNLTAVKDKVTMLKAGDEIVGGITVLDTPGHTPGHASYELAGEDGLIIVGDAIVSPIFFAHPDWGFAGDADATVAAASRKALLDRAATDRIKLIGYHWASPGLGFAERKDNAYRYVPA